jgi:hypothetical protein
VLRPTVLPQALFAVTPALSRPRQQVSATVVIGYIERAHRLLSDWRIFALGSGWKLQHHLVPLATTTG